MDKQRRKELLEAYKEIKIMMGVFQITNTQNGKIYLDTSPNLKNQWLTVRMQLDMGRHMNGALQADWNALGPDAFAYKVLEEKENKDIPNVRQALKEMKAAWMELLAPYGEQGYHKQA